MRRPALVVFGGLPGVGKTTLARRAALAWRAVYVRVDTIEVTLMAAAAMPNVGAAGYAVARALAIENLTSGMPVVVDCVNPLPVTREMWRAAAVEANVELIEIEIVCCDLAEHRRRVETRVADIVGHHLPAWRDVIDRDYAPWDRPPLRIDTAGRTAEEALHGLLEAVRNRIEPT